MKIKVLGNSSSGNCYLLQLEKETLILECGINYKEILKGLDFNLESVIGCLVTHEHKDHSKSLVDLTNNGIDVYSSRGTLEVLGIENHRTKVIESEKLFKIGNFKIMPFSTKHDAVEPLGFLINHEEIGNLLFITDSYYCEYNFKNLNHIMIECNYSKDLLDSNKDKIYLRNRIVKSHFELSNVINFLKANDLSNIKTITLLHLSEDNSDKNLFIREIEKNVGIPVIIAEKGIEIYL
ncbi:TPA: MBL fold metallo-hydrolase [Clostridioides difficile]|nr:MBL fold metallo-hydrolase [Clostridioides difficile]HBH3700785.1 MBL fold metallo-hydrolase [Clostridioides difficile]HBH4023418.1 MBL fold metallo-hydrolase [Clostridioides difficile]HCU2594729.1 MBL fold metallo-hydrolase [Clostridioides difficile]